VKYPTSYPTYPTSRLRSDTTKPRGASDNPTYPTYPTFFSKSVGKEKYFESGAGAAVVVVVFYILFYYLLL
jgi:hypothetical protein